MLGTYARIVEPGGHGMGFLDLAVRILQQQGVAAVQHSGTAVGDSGSVVAEPRAAPTGLHADDLDPGVGNKGVEGADGIRAAADARDERVRQPAGGGEDLRTCLTTDHRLQLPHEIRIRVRADDRAEQVISIERVRDPVAQRLVDGSAQRAIAALDRHDARTEQPHAPHVRRLALHVDGTHVHHTR